MSGTFFFKEPESFYDIKVEFQSSESTKALLLQWETSINTRTVAKSVIPTFRLFFQAHSSRDPQSLTVQPAIACATRCVFSFVLPLSHARHGGQVCHCACGRHCWLPDNVHCNRAGLVRQPLRQPLCAALRPSRHAVASDNKSNVSPLRNRCIRHGHSQSKHHLVGGRPSLTPFIKVPLVRSAVGIWSAIFSPPAPGGPMNVIVKVSVVACGCCFAFVVVSSYQVGLFGGLRGAYYDGTGALTLLPRTCV